MDEASREPTETQTIQPTADAPTDSPTDDDTAATEVLSEEAEEEAQVSTTAARQGSECLRPPADPRNREAGDEIKACLQAAKSKVRRNTLRPSALALRNLRSGGEQLALESLGTMWGTRQVNAEG